MSDTILSPGAESGALGRRRRTTGLLSGRQARKLRENLLAYLFLAPAFLLIFIFGLFPLIFAVYESTLRGLNRIIGTYDGLGNYVRAIDNLIYVLGIWLPVLFVYLAYTAVSGTVREARTREERPWPFLLPALILGAGLALATRFLFILIPALLAIADQMREAQRAGEGPANELFRRFLGEMWAQPSVQQPFWIALAVLLLGAVVYYLVGRTVLRSRRNGRYFADFLKAFIFIALSAVLLWFTFVDVQLAYAEALAEGETLTIWDQVVTISGGLILLGASWLVWRSASYRDSNLSTFGRLAAASLLIIGAWVLIGELPAAIENGDSDWWEGLLNTVYYSAGSIPFQFAIALMLATFLFQNIKGKTFFRMIFFLPYITPAVGAAAVFRILFSGNINSPANSLLRLLGIDSLGWLAEPTGIFQILLGNAIELPVWASGPSLSLTVIIIFGIWTFVGFNTVILLAGLGAIPSSLYEAASIDGAGRWAQFRNVTLPLLSPTIYFLTLYAVIGTFKAFNHIYVLRTPAALGTADTASVVIFDAMKRDTRYGYAAALAVLLLLIIMALTVINNRIASKRVFYG